MLVYGYHATLWTQKTHWKSMRKRKDSDECTTHFCKAYFYEKSALQWLQFRCNSIHFYIHEQCTFLVCQPISVIQLPVLFYPIQSFYFYVLFCVHSVKCLGVFKKTLYKFIINTPLRTHARALPVSVPDVGNSMASHKEVHQTLTVTIRADQDNNTQNNGTHTQ